MIGASSFLIALSNILHLVITAYTWIIIAAALISWVRPDPYSQIVQILYKLTAPAYRLIARLKIPTTISGIDLAPILIIIVLHFLDTFLTGFLLEIAHKI